MVIIYEYVKDSTLIDFDHAVYMFYLINGDPSPTLATLGVLLYALFVGFVEETAKLLCYVNYITLVKPESLKDYVVPYWFIGLLFAFLENKYYITEFGFKNAVVRSTLVFHFITAVIISIFIVRSLERRGSKGFLYVFGGVFLVAVIHGLWDFVNNMGKIPYIFLLTFHLLLVVLAFLMVKNSADRKNIIIGEKL